MHLEKFLGITTPNSDKLTDLEDIFENDLHKYDKE